MESDKQPYDPKLDAAFGAPAGAPQSTAAQGAQPPAAAFVRADVPVAAGSPAAPPAPKLAGDQSAKRTIGALDFEALGAKAYQAATFGFGADIDRMMFGKQAEHATRQLTNLYDQQHPMAAFGVDLAMAAVESAILPGAGKAQVVKSGTALLGRQAAGGAIAGALAGAGAGGNAETRAKRAFEGGLEGAVSALGLGGAGLLLRPVLGRLGPAGFSQVKAGADAIKRALATEGKSPGELATFMRKNPDGRLADFSPKVADLVAKVSSYSNETVRHLGENLRADVEWQAERLTNFTQPLMHLKQQLLDDAKALMAKKDQAYRSAYAEVTPLTAELKAALNHPDVKSLVDNVLADYQKLRMNPKSAVAQAPKYKVGEEIPTAVIDDLQKQIGRAANDKEVIGTMKAGALQAAHAALKDAQPASLDAAQRLAATVGGEATETGILGAQTWGANFVVGMKGATIDHWRAMSPVEQQYARIGMADGFERYLREHARMPAGFLDRLGDKLNDPVMVEALGQRMANRVKAVFRTEAARVKNSEQMARGGSHRAAFEEENTERMLSHAANVLGGGAIGSIIQYAASKRFTEPQVRTIIDIATKPGGVERLRQAGIDKNLLDRIAAALGTKGLGPGSLTQQGRPQITDD